MNESIKVKDIIKKAEEIFIRTGISERYRDLSLISRLLETQQQRYSGGSR